MLWNDLKSKKIGLWGINGKEGQSALRALNHFATPAQIIEIDESHLDRLNSCDIVIKSPGVSLYRPEIRQAKANGVQFISGSSLFMHNKPTQTKVIGITGTKGKSTTSALLYHTLQTAGLKTAFGGNIGKPLLDLLQDDAPDYVVAELSSYQCADFNGQCDIAILTNLFPEHLQWHQTHEQYYLDKCHMIQQAHLAFVNGTNKTVSDYLSHLLAVQFFNTASTFHVQDNDFYQGTQKLFAQNTLPLIGNHNAENACSVLSVAHQLNIDMSTVQQAFKTFEPLPHRLQIVGTYGGITFVDDSISTTPETAIAAVRAFDKGQFITLIVGGYERGQDFSGLIQFLSDYRTRIHLITLPDTGLRAYQTAHAANIPTTMVQTLDDAVTIAYQLTPSGGTVLLSPASPSYNTYKNFEERGLDFQHLVSCKQTPHLYTSRIVKKDSSSHIISKDYIKQKVE